MRGYRYLVEWKGRMHRCVSVSLAADVRWWGRHGVERLWLLARDASFGQAFEWKERKGAMKEPGEWVPTGSRSGIAFDEPQWKRLDAVYPLFAALMEGRCLHREEMEPFLAANGLDLDETEWLALAQWGALEGAFRLHRGVVRSEGGGWGWSVRRRWRALREGDDGRKRGQRDWSGCRCVRCGSGGKLLVPVDCPYCGEACPYCEGCLTMGRIRYCSLLVQGCGEEAVLREGAPVPLKVDLGRWGLTAAQYDAASAALAFVERDRGSVRREEDRFFLVWAVTGAGKTEMMFPLIESALRRGGSALIATPRKDVVLELAPRVKAAFPEERVVTLFGGSEERWARGRITVATTHQLFRFREAFDLVVVDEIDAFPFHGDERLYHAARSVCRGGGFVLLSATPPKRLRRLAERGRLAHARVCVRFHGHPLPVPKKLAVLSTGEMVRRGRLAPGLLAAVAKSLERGAQLFVFVPRIDRVQGMTQLLRESFPEMEVEGTSSKDEDRTEKVERFRGKQIRMIVTTTILERGVTVPRTDVFILDADSSLFDEASLIQMAGRAGRKLEDPNGLVYFCAPEWTAAQREAVRQIRGMNTLARKKGYLKR